MLVIYNSSTTSFSNLGLGVLKDLRSDALITEEFNGSLILEFEYIKQGYLCDSLVEGNLIKCNNQIFRIKNINKSLSDSESIKILAQQYFQFDMSKNFLVDVAPTKLNGTNALKWIVDKAETKSNFVIGGDCTNVSSARYVRKNVSDAIYSADNSLLSRFGGELEFNLNNVYLKNKRGSDKGFSIRYRKNLKGLEFNLDFSTVATKICPQGSNELLLDDLYVSSPKINNYYQPFFKKVEFNDIGVDEETTEEQAKILLKNAALELFDAGIDVPEISIKVDFVELSKCIEYKEYQNLETCSLGDTIKVIIPEFSINTSVRVVKTIFNDNLGRLTYLELGTVAKNIVSSNSSSIKDIKNTIENPKSILDSAKKNATELINHPFKGNLYIDDKTGVLYLMDTNDISTAKNVWKWSMGGLGFSSNGINGTFNTAITQNGGIVADFITTGKINTDLIEGYSNLELAAQNSLLSITPQYSIEGTDIWSDTIPNVDTWQRILTRNKYVRTDGQITYSKVIPYVEGMNNLINYIEGTDVSIYNSNDDEMELKSIVLDGKSTQETSTRGINYCPDIDKWSLSNGAYIENGYIVFPKADAKAISPFIPIDKKQYFWYAYAKVYTEIENNYLLCNTEYYDIDKKRLSGNGNASLIKNVSVDNDFNWNFGGESATQYGQALYNAKYIKLIFSNSSTYTKGTYKIKEPMISSERQQSFIPYVPNKPSPEYPSEIETIIGNVNVRLTGKNLFNYEWFGSSKAIPYTYYHNLGIKYMYAIPIYVGIGKYVTATSNVPENDRSCIYLINNINAITYYYIDDKHKRTIQANDDGYVYLVYGNTRPYYNELSSNIYHVQIEEGSVPTEDEPYKEKILNINLQGNELCSLFNNVKDELVIENGRAKIIKNIGKYNITGNETWALSSSESQPYINFSNYVNDCKYPTTTTELPNLLSNYYLQITRNNLYDGRITLSPNKALIIYDTVHNTSLVNFKEWLKSASVVIYYQLATAIEIDLGELKITKLFSKDNNIINSEHTNMLVGYYTDYTFYKTVLEQYAKIDLNNDNINIELAKKTNSKDIIATINMSTEKDEDGSVIQINSDKLNLKNKVFNLDTENITIKSPNFNVDKNGNIEVNNGSFKGNIYLPSGGYVLGGNGLLTVLKFESNIRSAQFLGANNFLPLYYSGANNTKDFLEFDFDIPDNFTILSAYVKLEHMPVNHNEISSGSLGTGYCRNLKLYKAKSMTSGSVDMNWSFGSTGYSNIEFNEITGAFGSNGFTGSLSGYTSQKSIDLKAYISTGNNIFKIETSDGFTQGDYSKYGAARATLYVYGYTNVS